MQPFQFHRQLCLEALVFREKIAVHGMQAGVEPERDLRERPGVPGPVVWNSCCSGSQGRMWVMLMLLCRYSARSECFT